MFYYTEYLFTFETTYKNMFMSKLSQLIYSVPMCYCVYYISSLKFQG